MGSFCSAIELHPHIAGESVAYLLAPLSSGTDLASTAFVLGNPSESGTCAQAEDTHDPGLREQFDLLARDYDELAEDLEGIRDAERSTGLMTQNSLPNRS